MTAAAIYGRIDRVPCAVHGPQRAIARQRLPSAAHDAVACDDDLRVAAARRREAAAHADARGRGRERALIDVNRRRARAACAFHDEQATTRAASDGDVRSEAVRVVAESRNDQPPAVEPFRIATTCRPRTPTQPKTRNRPSTHPRPSVARLTMLVTHDVDEQQRSARRSSARCRAWRAIAPRGPAFRRAAAPARAARGRRARSSRRDWATARTSAHARASVRYS